MEQLPYYQLEEANVKQKFDSLKAFVWQCFIHYTTLMLNTAQ